MTHKYLIRLDDACPPMNRKKWERMEHLLFRYGIAPMVGVIPHNEDPLNMIDEPDNGFWDKVIEWERKGWTIAMHGYNHKYEINEGLKGLNPMWKETEFVGLSLKKQKEKIQKGIAIMREHGYNPKYFFAPSHTFDENTLIALKEETDIRIISDTIAANPYRMRDFVFIPQQSGHPVKLPFGGLVTICYHPNTMDERAFVRLEEFLKSHQKDITSFDKLDLSRIKSKTIYDRFLSWLYFLRRKLR